MSCLGCWYFEPIGGNLGYCEIQDHVVTVNDGCDEREDKYVENEDMS